MSLSERMQEAAAERRGQPQARKLEVPEPEAEVAAQIEAGMPAPCPRCYGPGFLDLIDVRRRRQHEHCVSCRVAWSRAI